MRERRIAIDVDDAIVSQAARYVVARDRGWQVCNNRSTAELTIAGLRVPEHANGGLELLVVPRNRRTLSGPSTP